MRVDIIAGEVLRAFESGVGLEEQRALENQGVGWWMSGSVMLVMG